MLIHSHRPDLCPGILQNLRVQHTVDLPAARRWEDLTQPRLLGWVGAGDPRNSGTMTVMYESFLQAYRGGQPPLLLSDGFPVGRLPRPR